MVHNNGMAGTLHVVATPIGNLEDITLRALRVLKEVAVIAAEDTRRTAQLLAHFGIRTPLVSLHEHNERARVPTILARLRAGDQVALVSDAGTPGVSDPGALLVREARKQGLPVTVVPGASAVTFMAAAAGLEDTRFSFAGFPPPRGAARRDWFGVTGGASWPIIFFESPHRIRQTLEDGSKFWGKRQIIMGRELTKIHEELLEGSITSIINLLNEPRGEYSIVLLPAQPPDKVIPTDEEIWVEFCRMTENDDLSRRQAVLRTAAHFSVPPRTVYAAVERVKQGLPDTDSGRSSKPGS